ERDKYLTYLGIQTSEKPETIEEIWKKDMGVSAALMGGNLPDEQKNYKKVLEGLQGVVRSHAAANQELASKLREAKATDGNKTAQYEKAKKDLTAEKDEKIAAYEAARKQVTDELNLLNDSKTKMADDIAKKEKEWEAKKSQYDDLIAKSSDKLAKMQTQIQLKTEDYNKLSSQFNVHSQPDGKIVWVNQRDNLAYINLGSDDLLRKRVTFSVYDPSTTDVTSGKSKDTGTKDRNEAIVSAAQ